MTERNGHRGNAAIYARISDDREGAGLGVARQREDCEQLAGRLGWPVADVLVDNDLSAYSGKPRPAYTRLLDGLRGGRYDAIVCWHPDRLHRSPRELEDFIVVLEETGAAIATVTAGDMDLSTPAGRMVARILGATARQESEHKSERIRRKHAELARAGRSIHGSRRPYGYRKGGLEVDPDEAAEIRAAVARLLDGEALISVVRDWRARLPTVDGGTWSQYGIKRLLTSGRVAGLRTHLGEVVAVGEWPAILTADEHERIRALLWDPARDTRAGAAAPRKHVLRGLAVCGLCGRKLVTRARTRQRGAIYLCDTKSMGGCGGVGVVAGAAEAEVCAQVFAVLAGPDLARLFSQGARADTAAVAEALRADSQRLDDLDVAHHADGLLSQAAYLTARERLTGRIGEARRVLAADTGAATIAGLPGTVDGLRAEWDRRDIIWRVQLLRAVIDSIVVNPAGHSGNRFDPRRLDIRWRA